MPQELPETMVLLKGNIIGRHLSREYFERVIGNRHYTFLYEDANYKPDQVVSSLLYESGFLELNNSWYANAKVHRYFSNYNQLLKFIFVDPIIPRWILFSPGGCYILPRSQIERYPIALFQTLNFLGSYRYFPSEAYFIERLMHTIFTANYAIQPYLYDFQEAMSELEKFPDRTNETQSAGSVFERLNRRIGIKIGPKV
jgi:hypothetical protein